MLLEGLNEKGLNVGMVYFSGYTQYTPAAKARPDRIMAPLQITARLQANIATVEEVNANVNSLDLTAQYLI